ncbi:pyroglutamyl-peptidase I [Alicyclobacillus sp. ALC3]|uniref:pyroglutamyl-peptidase I n=1 Tax=Alicyclobacillus sp. ALC3 TaxID=2796143 RepID=UPI0023787D4C|nr:pyroglutamyl-peptidase I [Alicyclobacillus sp. ALC3]WDL96235.1 pyroglutamyl-peptidase I [Alicyclobacillus sp. ALC3]
MTTVLVTGFEPFAGEPVNAAWEAVSALLSQDRADTVDISNPVATRSGVQIYVRQLPTAFGQARDILTKAIEQVRPQVVVCFGEAGGRSAISVERVGVNLDHARIADNAGNQPVETKSVEGAPDAYFSRLPVGDLIAHLRGAGLPAEESWSAGTFVCNHVLYGLMHLLQTKPWSDECVAAGFVHVPYLPEQAARHEGQPSLGREECARAVGSIVDYLVEWVQRSVQP